MTTPLSPAHERIHRWLDGAKTAIRQDLLERFVAELNPRIAQEKETSSFAFAHLAGGARKFGCYREARTVRAQAHQTLQIIVGARRHAMRTLMALRAGRAPVEPLALAFFLVSRALKTSCAGLLSPLSERQERENYHAVQSITELHRSLARQLLQEHATLFGGVDILGIDEVPTEVDLLRERHAYERQNRQRKFLQLVGKVERADVLTATELAFMRTFV